MLPSIKETDRLTDADRFKRVATGAILTVSAAIMNVVLYAAGFYSRAWIFALLMGLFVGFKSRDEYKGVIKMKPCDASMECPSCGEQDAMECYDEMHRTTTVFWASMIHCRRCGYIENQSETVAAAAGVARGGRLANGSANLSDDPVAKARAILAASKAKQDSTRLAEGRVVYAKVDTDETTTESMSVATAVQSTLELPPGGESASKQPMDADNMMIV